MVIDPPAVLINGEPMDPDRILLPLSIVHGRGTIYDQPDTPQAAFSWLGADPPVGLGDTIEIIWYGPAGSWSAMPRFTGRVVEIQAREDLWQVQAYEITCSGRMLDLALAHVTLTRPAETDLARVAAISAAAGIPVTVVGTTSTMLVPDDIDRDALSALHEIAVSSAAIIWEDPDGAIRYGAPDHRDAAPVQLLADTSVMDGLEWVRSVTQVINHVVITFGTEAAREQNTYRDDESIALWGLRSVAVESLCADEEQASNLAATILARRRNPQWNSPDVRIDSRSPISLSGLSVANSVRVGDGLMLPVPLAPGEVPSPVVPWTVEGWTERWDDPGRQEITLAVSDRSPWAVHPLRTWEQMRADTWQTWAAGSWLDLLVGATT